jgi:hypothetical protein
MSGDLILEVNGQDLRAAAYAHVAYTLKVRKIPFEKVKYINFFLQNRHFHMVVFILK